MTGQSSAEEAPHGAVPLAVAIAALRDELTRAWWDGQHQTLRFKVSPVELTLQVAVTSAGKGVAGVKWWLLELGGEISRQSVLTQTMKITLEPQIFDERYGEPTELVVEAAEEAGSPASDLDELPLEGGMSDS